MKYTVGIVSLGCDKNRVDSENIASRLKSNGYEIVGKLEDADIIIKRIEKTIPCLAIDR